MIWIVAGSLGGILMALDAQKQLQSGSATTLFRTFSRQDHPRAFWSVFTIKILASAALAILVAVSILRSPE